MLEDPALFVQLALIFTLAAFVQGVTGFAFGMVSMALLPHLMTVKAATPLVAVVAFTNVVCLLWQMRRSIDLDKTRWLLGGVLLGVPVGVLFLAKTNEAVAVRALAVVLLIAAGQGFLVKQSGVKPAAQGWAPFVGFAGGAIGGAFNVGGAPIIIYVYRQPWRKETMVAALQTVFFTALSYRLGIYLFSGMLSKGLLLDGLLMTPFTLLGSSVGVRLQRKMDVASLKLAVNVLLILLALSLFFR